MAIRLQGLAATWESDEVVRRLVRDKQSLVVWPSPETVGVPSMNLVSTWFNTCESSPKYT